MSGWTVWVPVGVAVAALIGVTVWAQRDARKVDDWQPRLDRDREAREAAASGEPAGRDRRPPMSWGAPVPPVSSPLRRSTISDVPSVARVRPRHERRAGDAFVPFDADVDTTVPVNLFAVANDPPQPDATGYCAPAAAPDPSPAASPDPTPPPMDCG